MIDVFVIHVKGATERAKHIEKELGKFNIKFKYILDGDKEDITQQHLDKYFAGEMNLVSAHVSCALKHIFAYQQIIENNIKQALIFEDDIILESNFNEILTEVIEEANTNQLSNYILSLENSNHEYVKKSEVILKQRLYKKSIGRCAGAYVVDLEFAKNILAEIKLNKCSAPIDWLHNNLAKEQRINIYWSYPHIAEQGSHNGKMISLIDQKNKGLFRKIVYFFQRKMKS